MDPTDIVKIYHDYGAAALFLALYLVTIFVFIRHLIKGNAKEVLRCEKLALLASGMVESAKNQTEVLEKLKAAIDSDRHETERLHAYLEARDKRRRRED